MVHLAAMEPDISPGSAGGGRGGDYKQSRGDWILDTHGCQMLMRPGVCRLVNRPARVCLPTRNVTSALYKLSSGPLWNHNRLGGGRREEWKFLFIEGRGRNVAFYWVLKVTEAAFKSETQTLNWVWISGTKSLLTKCEELQLIWIL